MHSAPGVPNIGTGHQRARLLVGVVTVLIGAGSLAAFVLLGAPRVARAVLFVPFWIGALGILQARAGICVGLAARGLRDMGGGAAPIDDSDELSAVRARAARIHRAALIVAAVATLTSLVL